MEELLNQLKEDIDFYEDSSISDETKLDDMTKESNFIKRVKELINIVEESGLNVRNK